MFDILRGFINIFKVSELRGKIFFTFFVILVCRIAANIPCPGVNIYELGLYLKQFDSSSSSSLFFGIFDMFTGGAIEKFAITTLGILPYISASIIMQMLQPVIPSIGKMLREEGDIGRYKFNKYVKYLTLIICIIQGIVASYSMIYPSTIGLPIPNESLVLYGGMSFMITTVIIITCGTMILVFLGEKITENGIGNGASIIISIGILSRFPNAIYSLYEMFTNEISSIQNIKLIYAILLIIIFLFAVISTVLLIQGHRRIPIQYMKGIIRGNISSSRTSYVPLKVNFSGVMPLILSSAIIMIPIFLMRAVPFLRFLSKYFIYGSILYAVLYGIMILFFSYFWVANQFDPINLSERLRRDGAFVPGIRPGNKTAEHFDRVMTLITFSGAIFLIFISILPMIISNQLGIQYIVSSFFGGTSLIIVVGVTLDVLNQLDTYIVSRDYDSFIKDGRIIGRRY